MTTNTKKLTLITEKSTARNASTFARKKESDSAISANNDYRDSKYHIHFASDLSTKIVDQFYDKISQTESLRKMLEDKITDLEIPDRSYAFGLEMINHVFDTVAKQIEIEKQKIMEEFRQLIKEH